MTNLNVKVNGMKRGLWNNTFQEPEFDLTLDSGHHSNLDVVVSLRGPTLRFKKGESCSLEGSSEVSKSFNKLELDHLVDVIDYWKEHRRSFARDVFHQDGHHVYQLPNGLYVGWHQKFIDIPPRGNMPKEKSLSSLTNVLGNKRFTKWEQIMGDPLRVKIKGHFAEYTLQRDTISFQGVTLENKGVQLTKQVMEYVMEDPENIFRDFLRFPELYSGEKT